MQDHVSCLRPVSYSPALVWQHWDAARVVNVLKFVLLLDP